MTKNDIVLERSVLTLLCKLFDKNEYLSIAKRAKPKIPGFTPKKFSNVPFTLLKNHTSKKLLKISNLDGFFNDFLEFELTRYSNLVLQDFIVKADMESLSPAKKLALFFVLFQEQYKEHKPTIEENIANQSDPFDSLFSFKPTLAQKLGIMFESVQDATRKLLTEVASMSDDVTKDNLDRFFGDAEGETLKEILLEKNVEADQFGLFNRMLVDFNDEINEWNDNEKATFFQLVLYETAILNKLLHTAGVEGIESHDEERNELEKKNKKAFEQFQKEKDVVDQKLNTEIQHKKELEKELKLRDGTNDELNQTIKKLQTELKIVSSEKDEIIMINKQLNRVNKESEAEKNDTYMGLFEKESRFCLITLIDDPMYHLFLKQGEGQFLYVNTINDAIEALHKGDLYKHKIIYINTDGLTTKDQFMLENELSSIGAAYRFVSDGPLHIIKKIIYYLEGDMRYEIKI